MFRTNTRTLCNNSLTQGKPHTYAFHRLITPPATQACVALGVTFTASHLACHLQPQNHNTAQADAINSANNSLSTQTYKARSCNPHHLAVLLQAARQGQC